MWGTVTFPSVLHNNLIPVKTILSVCIYSLSTSQLQRLGSRGVSGGAALRCVHHHLQLFLLVLQLGLAAFCLTLSRQLLALSSSVQAEAGLGLVEGLGQVLLQGFDVV